jgi:uncharacterized protein
MPHSRPARAGHPDQSRHASQRSPLVFGTRALGPGTVRTQERTVPAPADLGAGLVGVAPGAPLELTVQLEGVTEGVLVTATVTAPLTGECARCLEPFTAPATVRFQELYSYDPGADGPDEYDGYALDGDLLDLEPALRDALVLELPLSPLCRPDCPGLCPECGIRLADAGPGHRHEPAGDSVWAVLRELELGDGAAAPDVTPEDDATTGPHAGPDLPKEQ